MSTQIYYEHEIFKIPASIISAHEDQYLQVTLDGASNSYSWDNKRVRQWHIQSFGCTQEIIASAIAHAHYFEGAMSSWKTNGRSGHLSAQSWIKKVRAAVSAAKTWDPRLEVLRLKCGNALRIEGKRELQGLDQHTLIIEMHKRSVQALQSGECQRWFNLVGLSGPGAT